jgi:DNA polymerase
MMLVGEQPGDREDRAGEPFVGPAGRILDESMEAAGIDRRAVYVTNAVKHFKWRQGRGKRRIHQRPSVGEVNACLPWLRAEVDAVGPAVIVCMGATAARAVLGPGIKVTADRGSFAECGLGALATVTVHPSSLLRIRDRAERTAAKREFIADLRAAGGRADLHV